MAVIYKKVQGHDLLQEDLPNSNFICSDQENLYWSPTSPSDYSQVGLAYNTFHPTEANVTWLKAGINYTINSPTYPNYSFEGTIGLYGIMEDGGVHLIGEKPIVVNGTGSLTVKEYFDLKGSGGNPPVYKDTGTASAGKVRLNLPFRAQNIDSCDLYKVWKEPAYTGRNRHDLINNNTTPIYNCVVGPLWIETASPGGDILQRDISIADSDGKTGLCFWRDPMATTTPGQEAGHAGHARYFIRVPYVPGWTSGKVLYSYYGGQGASPTDYSSGFNVFKDGTGVTPCYDDWEDGLYTGRTWPYRDWINVLGTTSIESATPITGTYSLKHTGPNTGGASSADYYIGCYRNHYLWPYIVEFDWELHTQGSDTFTPYVALWYLHWKDYQNNVRLDTFYEAGTTTQWLRLWKVQAGVPTDVAKVSLGGRMAAGYKVHVKVLDHWNGHVQVWWNDKIALDTNYTINWGALYNNGFGALRDSAAKWDNFIFYQPVFLINSPAYDFNYPSERWYNQLDYGPYLEDNFDDNSIDTNKWVAVLGSGASTPAETGSELRVSGTGTHRAYLRTKRKVRAPWAATFRAKKSENIEFTFDWNWGGIQSGYTDIADTGYTFRYASWAVPTVFQLIKNETGVATVLSSVNYTLDTNYHTYRIQRTYNGIMVYIDGVFLMSGLSSYCTGGYQGFSARETPAAVNAYYDDYKVGGFLSGKDTYSATTPVAIAGPAYYLEYTTPVGWLEGGPYHFNVKETFSGEYETGDILLSTRNIARLGYDNVDKYKALRFQIDILGRTDVDFRINGLEYYYNL